MSAIFNNLRVYRGKWEVSETTALDEQDQALFTNAKVVNSEYGKSVCFFMKQGGTTYIPISRDTEVNPELGDSVDLKKVEIQTLSRQGDEDIYRAVIKA